ncbi:biotin/lipoyl-containing protein [Komagataeibacter saccharivorans]|uniref:acetyl-CoA carboxylase biotin carboxyl carrier protein n=1 Tax=Komagataeibacter saccharivorans TaxID=265959 RepID=UPI0024A8EBAF|nr:biotin/lipoyl-containing protein [Komagataeibacter saccharivorans]
MDIAQIKRLIDLLAHAPIAELEAEEGGRKIRITRGVAQPVTAAAVRAPAMRPVDAGPGVSPRPQSAPMPEPVQEQVIAAPSYGILHLSPAPGAPPYVTVGQEVKPGQEVGLVEAMKVFNAVKSTQAGQIAAILVEDGTEVEAGTPLFRLA